MSITLEQAKELKYRETLIDGYGKRWYVNGKITTWKTDPTRIRVPLKHGLYSYDALTTEDFDAEGVCEWLTKEYE